MIALLCFIFAVQGVARENNENETFIIYGKVQKAFNVDYKIYTNAADGTEAVIEQGSIFKFFDLELETGQKYKISFTKDSLTKTLYVSASKMGSFSVDIDFRSDNCASLSYNYNLRSYKLRLIDEEHYAQNL